MKKNINLTLVVFLIFANGYSQVVPSTLASLIGKIWTYRFEEEETTKVEIRYSPTTEYAYYTSEEWEEGEETPFYLSDSIVTAFDDSKIGTVYNGKYIITKDKSDETGCYEIVELTTTKLKIRKYDGISYSDTITFSCY